MCHAWITHWTVARASVTIPRLHYTWSRLLEATELYLTDKARATNIRAVEMCMNPFWRVREPVWRLERPFLNHDVRDRRAEYGKLPTYQIKHF